jgi:transposase
MNTKLHAVTDANGRPISLFLTASQVSDYIGAAALIDSLPKAQWLLGDRGYDADWFREALQAKGIIPRIPGRKSLTEPIRFDKRRYKSWNRIEIMIGRLKDWRRVATRYDRCPTVFLSAVALAATVLFWLWVLTLAIWQARPWGCDSSAGTEHLVRGWDWGRAGA